MKFIHIPANKSVLIDANILVYYFAPDPVLGPECRLLVDRVARYQDFFAVTSTHILSKVSHQLMVLEAAQLFGWPLGAVTRLLREHPAEIQKLSCFRRALDEVPRLGIEILPVERHLIPLAASLSQLHGLLTHDALTVAAMQDDATIHIASDNPDFDRVPGLKRYAPA